MHRTGNYLCFAIFALFTILTLWKLYPFAFPVSEAIVGYDDWNHYAQHAYDIKNNGLLLASVQRPYLDPAGFLYNYFIALFLWLGNDNLVLVYFMQGLMLSASICIVYHIFAAKLHPFMGYALLFMLALIGYFDIFRHYTFLLLSENLLLFTIPVTFYFLMQYEKNNQPGKLMLSVIFLAVSVLVRPNVFPFSLLMLAFITVRLYPEYRRRIFPVWVVFGLVLSILALRNYLVTFTLVFLPVNGSFVDYMGRVNLHSPIEETGMFFSYYLDRILFVLGFLPVVEPAYSFRPHWMVAWVGVGVSLYYIIRKKMQLEFSQWIMLLFIATFYGVLILIAPLYVYGFRMVTPALFMVTGFAFLGFNRWVPQ